MRWIVVFAVLAGGCAEGPSAVDLITGGISLGGEDAAGQVAGRLYRISVPRSKFAEAASVEDYALLRAAEATKRAGGTHFLVVRGAEETGGLTPPAAALAPGADYVIYFRVLDVAPAGPVSASALSVDEIMLFYGKRFAETPA
jgi:hypothetical protein